MKLDIPRFVCDPATHDPLEFKTEPDARGDPREFLANPKTGRRYPIRDGIPILLLSSEISGSNRRYQARYDRLAPFYDISMWLYSHRKGMSVTERCREYLEQLEISAGSLVLEVAVGTGRNLHSLPRSAEFYGLDISWKMLKQCQRHAARWKLEPALFMGAAERLPFRDEVFDVVFHFGGINYFSDQAAAVREMIRVARPGAKIVIGDENEANGHEAENFPFVEPDHDHRNGRISAPIHLLPPGVQDVQVKDTAGGDLYCLSFRRPDQKISAISQTPSALS